MAVEPQPGSRAVAPAPPPSAGELLEALPIASAILTSTGELVRVNESWATLVGVGPDGDRGRGFMTALEAGQRGVAAARLEHDAAQRRSGTADWRITGPPLRWTRWWWQPLAGDDSIVVCVVDIDDDKTEQGRLWFQATHDPLTALINRTEFLGLVGRALDRGERSRRAVAVVFADLDGFKAVNDHGGHQLGDRVLRVVADRLTDAVRPADAVARVGGDEFAVLCEDLGGEDEAQQVAARLRTAVTAVDIEVGGRSLTLGLSTGVATANRTSTPESLLARADAAMYSSRGLRTSTSPVTVAPATRSKAFLQLVDPHDPDDRDETAGTVRNGDRELSATLVHRIYGAGLQLASAASLLDGPARTRVEAAIAELDDLVRTIRADVFARIAAEDTTSSSRTLWTALDVLTDAEHAVSALWISAAADPTDGEVTHRLVEAARYVQRAVAAVTPTTLY